MPLLLPGGIPLVLADGLAWTDRYVVDGAVNLIGRTIEESSFWFRRVQTGLVQNYAMLIVFGVFVFVGVYLMQMLR